MLCHNKHEISTEIKSVHHVDALPRESDMDVNEWLERNRGYIIVLLLNLILTGGLLFFLHRPVPAGIRIVPATPLPPKTTLRVYISGSVIAPDVYELPVNSLVKDALVAAGGTSPEAELNQINLARQLKDQEQIFVPRRAGSADLVEERNRSSALIGDRINLNTATAAELESLPSIGPSLAQRIIEYRANNGSFVSAEDITNVSGIGDATYELIKDWILVN